MGKSIVKSDVLVTSCTSC